MSSTLEKTYDKYGIKYRKDHIKIPVLIVEDADKSFFVTSYEETEKYLPNGPHGSGATLEKAIEKFWVIHKIDREYLQQRADKAYKWIPFERGQWKGTGTFWFRVYGLHFYFRYGNGMKGGKYIPLTKLNISITNHWKKKKS